MFEAQTAIIAVTPGGAALARRLGIGLPRAVVCLPESLRQADSCHYFAQKVGDFLPTLFAEGKQLVCIMAAGIVVRTLAPHLRGKETDPAVVVLDEGGRFAVSLLSGHLGGANDLARKVARRTGGQAVVTTATDVNGLTAWDEAARREGLGIEPVRHLRRLNSLLLRSEKIVLVDRRGRLSPYYARLPNIIRAANFAEALNIEASGAVFVTHRYIPRLEAQENLLVLRPRDLVVGIGCNRDTPAEEIEEAIAITFRHSFLALPSIACLASIDGKKDESGILDCARRFGVPVEFHCAEDLNQVPVPSAPSTCAMAAVGAWGVCEPAALISAGAENLLVRKRRQGNVTVAVAEKA